MTGPAAGVDTLNLFAGPAGWEEGGRIIGLPGVTLGVEINALAAATATAAGHRRLLADVRHLDPEDFPGVTGAKISTPCPTLSRGGKGSGCADMQLILDAVTAAGGDYDYSWDQIEHDLQKAQDPRTALAAQTIRFALGLPDLEWLVLEQVPAAEILFGDIAAELTSYDDGGEDSVNADGTWNPEATGSGGWGPGWEDVAVFTVDALAYAMPVRRNRTYLVGRRTTCLGGRGVDLPYLPPTDALRRVDGRPRTMAGVLGWSTGEHVRTRGNLRGDGGNYFSADGPSWCLTGRARSWERVSDGVRLTPAEAGLLNGFRYDYPWRGSRTAAFGQAADVVVPPVAAAVLGYATGIPWRDPVARYLRGLYDGAPITTGTLPEVGQQVSLFDLLAMA